MFKAISLTAVLVLLSVLQPFAATLTNSTSPLAIPTYEGSGQLLHPSIVDFQLQHGTASWGGYRYWMVFTPFPYSGNPAVDTKDPNENPSIVASNDGYTWVVPAGVTNPIHQPTSPSGTHYDNDPELVYDPVEDCLRIYFNETDTVAQYHKFQMVKLYSNMTVSTLQVLSTFTWTGGSWAGQTNGLLVAPGIVRESAAAWHLWAVRDNGNGTFSPVYRFSTDGYSWGTVQTCNDVFTSISGFSSYPWHFEARYNASSSRVDILANVRSKSVFTDLQLAIVSTTFAAPTTLTQPSGLTGLILRSSSAGGWDSRRLYRSTFTADGSAYRIWYAGSKGTTDTDEVWHLGYADTSGFDPTITTSKSTATLKGSFR